MDLKDRALNAKELYISKISIKIENGESITDEEFRAIERYCDNANNSDGVNQIVSALKDLIEMQTKININPIPTAFCSSFDFSEVTKNCDLSDK